MWKGQAQSQSRRGRGWGPPGAHVGRVEPVWRPTARCSERVSEWASRVPRGMILQSQNDGRCTAWIGRTHRRIRQHPDVGSEKRPDSEEQDDQDDPIGLHERVDFVLDDLALRPCQLAARQLCLRCIDLLLELLVGRVCWGPRPFRRGPRHSLEAPSSAAFAGKSPIICPSSPTFRLIDAGVDPGKGFVSTP